MTPPAVSAPPPPAARPAAATRAPAPLPRARAPFSRRRDARPPLLTARTVGISLGLHAIMLLLVLLAPRPEPRTRVVAVDRNLVQGEVVQYLDVGEWGGMATDPAATLPEPTPLDAPATIGAASADSVLRGLPRSDVLFPHRVPAGIPRPTGGAPAAGQPASQPGGVLSGVPGAQGAQPGGQVRGRSGPGGLGPELGDERLVVTPTAVPERVLSDQERYQQHFEGRIRALNDSIANEAERRRRASDWTFTDRNGRKWGINERGPVVGGRNVPIPVPVPVPRSSRETEDAQRRERDQRREIDRQAEQIERERYLRDRGRAIRERNDRERQERQNGGGTQGTP